MYFNGTALHLLTRGTQPEPFLGRPGRSEAEDLVRQFLHDDGGSGELRLVFAGLREGEHRRIEYRVVDDAGLPVRHGQRFDGLEAFSHPLGRWYVRYGPASDPRTATFTTEKAALSDTRVPCRRLASKSGRAKCALCADRL
jgi:hypothetical protein